MSAFLEFLGFCVLLLTGVVAWITTFEVCDLDERVKKLEGDKASDKEVKP